MFRNIFRQTSSSFEQIFLFLHKRFAVPLRKLTVFKFKIGI